VPGAGRMVWHGKSLARCDVRTAQCHVLPHPAGVVELDPDWAPQGNHIAFVEARERRRPSYRQGAPGLGPHPRAVGNGCAARELMG